MSSVTNLVQVNKAVLTPDAIAKLEELQENNNDRLNAMREDMADVVCLIGRCMHMVDDECHPDLHNAINSLSIMRESLNTLRKP